MDRQSINSIRSLEFLISLFPDDDLKHKELKQDLLRSVERCKELLIEAEAEQKYSMEHSVEKTIKQEDYPELCPCASKECEKEYDTDLSEYRKAQLLKEAEVARDNLKEVLAEVERHLDTLKPGDKVEIEKGNVVITQATALF